MADTLSLLARTIFHCAACRYYDRNFCSNTMARRERADLREGDCSFWRSAASLSQEQYGGPRGSAGPLYG